MIRPLLLKPQWMNGLSERLLVSHYENNYGGALRRLNAIRARLAALDWARTPAFEINGLKREELIAAGSVILHEVYFDSLGGHGDSPAYGTCRTARCTRRGARTRFRERHGVARRVYQHGQGAGRRFRLGDPRLV
jgi:Fe-Mn family superoxide dismutase